MFCVVRTRIPPLCKVKNTIYTGYSLGLSENLATALTEMVWKIGLFDQLAVPGYWVEKRVDMMLLSG